MKPALFAPIALVLIALLCLSGCSGTGTSVSSDVTSERASGPEDPTVTESLERADVLYREALAHYVTDAWDEARPLLEEALIELNSLTPKSEDGRSERESLRARVCYFLDVVSGDDTGRPELARAAIDTVTVETAEFPPPTKERSSCVTIVRNERVDKWLVYFQTKGRKEMCRWISRAGRYRPMIDAVLEEYGLPEELFYLAVIESGLNPNAYSRAHACGMWQFISSRARMYDLRVDWWIDERRDPEKATRAAVAYLSDLYDMFGSWELALAGYNSGEGRVKRARKKTPSCPDYWCLDLPRETENFVPKFMAAVIIGKDPEAHGFTDCEPQVPLEYESIEVAEAYDLDLIARSTGTSTDEIKALNPALRRWCTPPSSDAATVYVPCGTGQGCLVALSRVAPDDRVTYQRHKIGRGETLSEIATAYGTTITAIASFNDIRNPHRIRAGQYLVIPVGPDGLLGGELYAGIDAETRTYKVRRGDTVSAIARRHGKRTKDVLRANGLGWHSRIYPGDTLKIPM